MQCIDVRQRLHIVRRVGARKAFARDAVARDQRLARECLLHQARELLARVPGSALQVAQHHCLVRAGQTGIAKAAYHCLDVGIALRPVLTRSG